MKMKRTAAFLTAAAAALSALCIAASADTAAFRTKDNAPAAGFSLSAHSAVVINAQTGTVICGKNEREKRAMASTTKIMTALLTIEAGDLDRSFTVDSMAIRTEGTSMGLREGDIVTRRALCAGMLLPSGNDAANAAAVDVAGSMSAFAELMNKKAKALGMNDTHFANPSGLDAPGHFTTAYDMALLTAYALKNETFADICSKKTIRTGFGSPVTDRTLKNSNKLLSMYEGCIGVKTGFTDNAGRCLVSAAKRGSSTLIAVTLGAPDDWNDHRKLLDHGFSRLSDCEIRIAPHAVPVIGGSGQTVTACAGNLRTGLLSEEAKNITVSYRLPDFVYASVEKDDIIGYADVKLSGKLLSSVPLRAEKSVPIKSGGKKDIKNIFDDFLSFFRFGGKE